ncbi:pyridoxamine 5'-phosphate oxidase family protein [Actibacterium sp. 188UL27-1]|uniref:pyridoxamine 5'-phosphate oxidase family protein n=1 Tax=Actibacterium sp. 188UL27-1 TaxID=2786961 RepID=UPI00195A119B|nr:pyridoxamine 5'-phosphate oxidase family protein [Actibacterium sp. 188UL27-1]MBM7066945.1 pyridoxamine 5'-phosphate oxidase family protein [Actibacterium sp. 188UL27-1]
MGLGTRLNDTLIDFIRGQHMFFVATAGRDGRVNVSPKGLDSLQVVAADRIVWLNVSGSGNETAAHVRETGRMTLMFCAFEGDAMILRAYGTATVLHPHDEEWAEAAGAFPNYAGARNVFDLTIEAVQTSCGTGVPLMDFKASRAETELLPFFEDMGADGVAAYWAKKNAKSLDGAPTGLIPDKAKAP